MIDLLKKYWESWKQRRREERAAQRLQDEEFRRTHEPCPICAEMIPLNSDICPECKAPFRDPVALQTWKLQQEIVALREQAADAHEQNVREKRSNRSNRQGCGCLLMVAGVLASLMFPPFGVLMLTVGFVVLIVGLFS